MGRKDELEARVRQTPLSERLDDCRTRIGKMCSEGRPPRMTIPVQYDDDDFYISTTLSDAQATIADLQGQVDKLKARLEIDVAFNMDGEAVPAPPNMPDGIECRDATIQLQDKEIDALQQRVAQLEGERDMYKRSSDTFAECVDNVREAMGLETTHYLVLPDDVADLKADHARVLELVQEREYEIKRRIWAMHGSRMGHQLYGDDGRLDCNTCFRKYSDESLETVYGFELYDANVLCAKAASLPAQAAQGGA